MSHIYWILCVEPVIWRLELTVGRHRYIRLWSEIVIGRVEIWHIRIETRGIWIEVRL
jgi:hypothetical protein